MKLRSLLIFFILLLNGYGQLFAKANQGCIEDSSFKKQLVFDSAVTHIADKSGVFTFKTVVSPADVKFAKIVQLEDVDKIEDITEIEDDAKVSFKAHLEIKSFSAFYYFFTSHCFSENVKTSSFIFGNNSNLTSSERYIIYCVLRI